MGFEIPIDASLIQREFMDIKLNLIRKTLIPFRKPSSHILFVSNPSNHPKQMLNNYLQLITKDVTVYLVFKSHLTV